MAAALTLDVLDYCKSNGSPVFLCVLDADAVFDGIPHSVMFMKAINMHCPYACIMANSGTFLLSSRSDCKMGRTKQYPNLCISWDQTRRIILTISFQHILSGPDKYLVSQAMINKH